MSKKYRGYNKPSSMKKMPKNILQKIRNKFVAIVAGTAHTIDIRLPATKHQANISIVWLSGFQAECEGSKYREEERMFRDMEDKICKQLDGKIKPLVKKHTATIKKFVREADSAADKHGVDREDLWDYLVGEV